jgi:hypothetical protein
VGLLSGMLLAVAGTALALTFRLRGAPLLEIAAWTLSAAVVSVSLGLLTGAAFVDPDWSHPRAMLNVPGRLAGTALLVLQAAFWFWLASRKAPIPVGLLVAGSLVFGWTILRLAALTLARRE